MHDLIIEFYSEEIPAGVQEWAASKIDKKIKEDFKEANLSYICLLYTSPSPRDGLLSRMPAWG